ncbi:MAG: glucose 1-dehydrogenase [Actinomycetota bacterium]|nr:glucose 1-dehydrogenase [Actinomycetota bacterium]
MRFDGQVAIVTGAAGGIGCAAVERFAAEGARVVAVDLPGTDLEGAVAVAKDAGGEALAVPADVTKAADVARYVDAASGTFGRIDHFFNNAGIEGAITPLLEYPDEMFDRVMAVNARGVFLGIKHVGAVMAAAGRGSIVNMASVAGLGGSAMISAYVASKHAVVGLTRTAAIELGPAGVRVNAVCPSPVETRMMRALETAMSPDDPQAVHDLMSARIPLGRYAEPEDVAAVVAFLGSDDARFLNGMIAPVDGGMRAS